MKKITLIVCCMLATYFARGQQIAVNPGGAPESTMTLEQLIEECVLRVFLRDGIEYYFDNLY